jgi:hypothetical protein
MVAEFKKVLRALKQVPELFESLPIIQKALHKKIAVEGRTPQNPLFSNPCHTIPLPGNCDPPKPPAVGVNASPFHPANAEQRIAVGAKLLQISRKFPQSGRT